MKTARFLLACAAASVLAACGTDPITAPAGPARHAVPAPRDGKATVTSSATTAATTTDCVMVVVVNPDGTTSLQCAASATSQIGTGS